MANAVHFPLMTWYVKARGSSYPVWSTLALTEQEALARVARETNMPQRTLVASLSKRFPPPPVRTRFPMVDD